MSAVVNDALTERVERDRRIARRCKEITAQGDMAASLSRWRAGMPGPLTFVQEIDVRGRPLVIPGLAVTRASLDNRSDEAAELLEGLIIEITEPDEP